MSLGTHLSALHLLGFWGVAGTLALYGVRHLRQGSVPVPPTSHGEVDGGQAVTVLRERFARGEIDQAEYEDRRKALAEPPLTWPDLH